MDRAEPVQGSVTSLDIETACAVKECPHYDATGLCGHSLDVRRNHIVLFALSGTGGQDYVGPDALAVYAALQDTKAIVGHNLLGFDIPCIEHHYPELGYLIKTKILEDTQLMAVAHLDKVSMSWLEQYDERRKELNRAGAKHREAGGYSLKTLAPYFLGVEPFWEVADKRDKQYALTDARHTLVLYEHLRKGLTHDGTLGFYREHLLPWAKVLGDASRAGVKLDFGAIQADEPGWTQKRLSALQSLEALWAGEREQYLATQVREVEDRYKGMADAAVARLKDRSKEPATRERYRGLAEKARGAILPLNVGSDKQLLWLLREAKGYDCRTLAAIQAGKPLGTTETHLVDRRGVKTQVYSTDKEVLHRLAGKGYEDVKQLLSYREADKLLTTYFPSYRDLAHEGVLYPSFNLSGTRTGRTSSSGPNFQNQPEVVRRYFVARPGSVLITRDLSGIEPLLIAYYSQDEALCKLLIDGGNFHSSNTPAFFDYVRCPESDVKKLYPEERDFAKEVGLSILYGAGGRRIQIAAMKRGIDWSLEECNAKRDGLRALYPEVLEFKERLDKHLNQGGVVTNLLGRKYRLTKEEVHMKGFNRLAQGGASDLLLESAKDINAKFGSRGILGGVRILVHDELVVEAPRDASEEASRIVEEEMTKWELKTPWGLLPLKVEGATGPCWQK